MLLVDLNNHARYPTLAVGQMAAVLRAGEVRVRLVSPLAVGVRGAVRDRRARPWGLLDERLRWWTAKTAVPGVQGLRKRLATRRGPSSAEAIERSVRQLRAALLDPPDVVLLSVYFLYADVVRALLVLCVEAGIPVLAGGPGFTDPEAVGEWLAMEGMSGVFAGECEPVLVHLVELAAKGEDLSGVPGCMTPGRSAFQVARPLGDLDQLPYPDYDGFPWELYPTRVVTMLTGRGCGWGVCTFCSDVLTSNGRTFRTRSLEHVLGELAHQSERHGVRLFHFSDLKLNSNVELWRGLLQHFQATVPGAQWTCSVHLGGQGDQGLSFEDLKQAREAGLVRITTGVESGSQELLNRMAKGVRVSELSRFVSDARRADISVRVTMFTGYPGEGSSDLDASTRFLAQHSEDLDRVHLSRFSIQVGAPITHRIQGTPEAYPDLAVQAGASRGESLPHTDARMDRWRYRRAIGRLLGEVHRINRRPLRATARALEGAM
ncbi:MAG: radical SAM protein [Planctomycetota bacterium]|nr:radical SAM protein [Planctomycetota bacterium]